MPDIIITILTMVFLAWAERGSEEQHSDGVGSQACAVFVYLTPHPVALRAPLDASNVLRYYSRQ